ncbi:hypothetical protein B14911_05866 [Bacillus sp. NRRL B-14911]|uniref:Uncharacterized protein n=1 Tax=Bacillus infantis NRRL B-14911 TaxID=1367477 RepID=U5L8E5_9BACI|nr:hypothetical protein N288_05355 [Bacillus infantis NRRL B-14911]EAR63183.1 hypothetical protein B14911_05866 [Bacillus sp. NRRL B-14911]
MKKPGDAWLFLLFSLYMERGGDGMKEKKHRKRRQKGSMHPFIVFTLLMIAAAMISLWANEGYSSMGEG